MHENDFLLKTPYVIDIMWISYNEKNYSYLLYFATVIEILFMVFCYSYLTREKYIFYA